MKKLMIAAAMAAVIGGVEAATGDAHGVYDITASVYGMAGTKSKDKSANYTVYLGKDASGNFWYQDQTAIEWNGTTGTVADVVCVYAQDDGNGEADLDKKCELKFPADVTEVQKEAVAAAFGFDITAKKPATVYNTKSAKQWCATFKFKHTDYAKCYRVAKNYKLYGTLDLTCCDDMEGNGILSRFGGPTLATATKVDWVSEDYDILLASKDGTVYGWFTLAGRGTWNDNIKVGNQIYSSLASLSGYCIGYQDSDITCESCCEDGAYAIQFECDSDDDPEWYECDCDPGMAGTFSMKFNKKTSYIED